MATDTKNVPITIVNDDDTPENQIHMNPSWERNAPKHAHVIAKKAEALQEEYVIDTLPKTKNGEYFSADQGVMAVSSACMKLFGTPPTPLPMGRRPASRRPVSVQRFDYIGLDGEYIYEMDLDNPQVWTTKRLVDYIERNIPDYVFPKFSIGSGNDLRPQFYDAVKATLTVVGARTETLQVPDLLLQYPGNDDIQIFVYSDDGADYGYAGELFHLALKAKQMDRELVDQFYREVIDQLEQNNLFTGRCFQLAPGGKVQYINPFDGMDPLNLVFSTRVNMQLHRQIISVIKHWERAKKRNPALLGTKALLSGKPGTGKSEAMKLIQQEAIKNGWTCASLAPGSSDEDRDNFFNFITPLGRVVIIREDVETDEPDRQKGTAKEIAEARSKQLAHSDGIMSKGTEWMVITTTNDEDALSTASIRPGRIDVYVRIEKPDFQAFVKLITDQAGEYMPEDVDLLEMWGKDETQSHEASRKIQGLAEVPAPFLTNGLIETIQRFALEHEDGERLTDEEMYWSLDSVSNHANLYDRLEEKENAEREDPLGVAFRREMQEVVSSSAPGAMILANK